MHITIIDQANNDTSTTFVYLLKSWGFALTPDADWKFAITKQFFADAPDTDSLLQNLMELFFNALPFTFESLPLLVEGESKILRLLTDNLVVEKFKPTVYSYTHNRYGIADGTDNIRVTFSAALYRRLFQYKDTVNHIPISSFVAEIKNSNGHFMVQKKVTSCNLEVRIKRYHIGSPLHRYKYTELHHTVVGNKAPLTKWSRLEFPVVCFDWRQPLTDDNGNRLADEPISDDYARVWMEQVDHAKEMARNTFLWIEALFAKHGIILVDMCIFIDQTGKIIYGEISPDCMRIRWASNDLETAQPLCKDNWRNGKSSDELLHQYTALYHTIFNTHDQ
jgi:phosphoribosylaminoimidazole-succinocarboxamide synthase